MIHSMTGYAMVIRELPQGSLNLELRSVNNRYLDIQFRLPDEFRSLEAAMREFLTSRLNRGKVECRLNFSRLPESEDIQIINSNLFQKLLELDRPIRAVLPEARGLEMAEFCAGPESWVALRRRWRICGTLYRLAPVWPGRACGCQIPRGGQTQGCAAGTHTHHAQSHK